jgi:hypothetical protein
MPKKSEIVCPESRSNFWLNLLCCGIFFCLIYFHYADQISFSFYDLVVVIFITIIPIIIHDVINADRIHKGYATTFKIKRKFSLKRLTQKLAALYLTFGFVALIYWLFPVYHGGLYMNFLSFLKENWSYLFLFSGLYIAVVDLIMKDPKDSYYHIGGVLMLNQKEVDWRLVFEHIKAWVVKAFFLPLMTSFIVNNVNSLINYNFVPLYEGDKREIMKFLYEFCFLIIFSIDLIFAAVGYLMTLKIFNSQIYSAEPTTIGWISCLCGYVPFWSMLFYGQYFAYNDGYYWGDLLWGNDVLYLLWGVAILGMSLIYSLATVAFGYRFSNLTYRGLITGGPYRYTKHPAYIFKNLSWWLISVPFITHDNIGAEEALRNCLLLFGVNVIYFIRARTEENHLSNYPEYVEYAKWMNENGLFAWMGRLIPYLRYSEERALRSGSSVYKPFVQRDDLTAQALDKDEKYNKLI